MKLDITEKQAECVLSIEALTEDLGFPPTYREIADYLGCNLNDIPARIVSLQRGGWITKKYCGFRSVRISEEPDVQAALKALSTSLIAIKRGILKRPCELRKHVLRHPSGTLGVARDLRVTEPEIWNVLRQADDLKQEDAA